MKKIYFMFALLTAAHFVSACSPINSMEPFDDKQAAIVARGMMPNAYSAKPVRGSEKN